ncbi:MAG: type II secretion system minor pseudopilin GspK [Sphingomonadaceae bacterium]|nr:type II secretion system minor pseudopilin GspK [Sphingomonadaceae bacterium]
MKRSEQGAALLSVLLLVAVMAVLAAAALEKLKLATHLATNAAAIDQARAYAMAGETIALYRIGDLIQRDANRTTREGDWEGRETSFPIDGGIASARLSDGGNCFNLNSVVQGDVAGGLTVRQGGVEEFARLMTLLDVPPNVAQGVALATADWIDSDTVPLQGGAEDDTYQRGPLRYRTANTLMADRSELRAVAGVTPELYARLQPFLCALPVHELSSINVDTLTPQQAPLLAMLSANIDPARARSAIEQRPPGGWVSTADFWKQPMLAGVADAAKGQAVLNTRWFGLRLLVELAGAELEENALIDGGVKPGRLVRRSYGEAT